MNYTSSPDHVIQPVVNQPRHEDTQAAPTVVSDGDINSLIWELMEIVKAGVASGVYPAALAFDATNPLTYTQVVRGINALAAASTNANPAATPPASPTNGQVWTNTGAAQAGVPAGATAWWVASPAPGAWVVLGAGALAAHIAQAQANLDHTQFIRNDLAAPQNILGDLNFSGASLPRFGVGGANMIANTNGTIVPTRWDDCNTLPKIAGFYHLCSTSQILNAPANTSINAQVIQTVHEGGINGYCSQIITSMYHFPARIAVRNQAYGVWSAWVELTSTATTVGYPQFRLTGAMPAGARLFDGSAINAATEPLLAAMYGAAMPVIGVGMTLVQAASGYGTVTAGQVVAHTHSTGLAFQPSGGTGSGIGSFGFSSVTGSTGGANNLAAGVQGVWFCQGG